MKKLKNIIRYIIHANAWVRINIWGFCPECNSDAPEIDNCKVCNWDTGSPFGKSKRAEYWHKYKSLHNI